MIVVSSSFSIFGCIYFSSHSPLCILLFWLMVISCVSLIWFLLTSVFISVLDEIMWRMMMTIMWFVSSSSFGLLSYFIWFVPFISPSLFLFMSSSSPPFVPSVWPLGSTSLLVVLSSSSHSHRHLYSPFQCVLCFRLKSPILSVILWLYPSCLSSICSYNVFLSDPSSSSVMMILFSFSLFPTLLLSCFLILSLSHYSILLFWLFFILASLVSLAFSHPFRPFLIMSLIHYSWPHPPSSPSFPTSLLIILICIFISVWFSQVPNIYFLSSHLLFFFVPYTRLNTPRLIFFSWQDEKNQLLISNVWERFVSKTRIIMII